MRPLSALYVVYDAGCGFCSGVRDWVARHGAFVPMRFLASDSPEVRARFPQLPAGELAVVADTGEVWLGNHAWIVCLWALRDYRDWALRLSRPPLSLMAREAFAAVSRNKCGLSSLLGLKSDRELEQQLRKISVPICENNPT